jgi:hypothetical protein
MTPQSSRSRTESPFFLAHRERTALLCALSLRLFQCDQYSFATLALLSHTCRELFSRLPKNRKTSSALPCLLLVPAVLLLVLLLRLLLCLLLLVPACLLLAACWPALLLLLLPLLLLLLLLLLACLLLASLVPALPLLPCALCRLSSFVPFLFLGMKTSAVL